MLRDRDSKITFLVILLTSVIQPYVVLITEYGMSSKCMDCFIIEQTLIPSLFYLAIPIFGIYLILKWLKLNLWLSVSIVAISFYIISFLTITYPLFDDRIAAWSTFTDTEVLITSLIMSFPSLITLTIVLSIIIISVNRNIATKTI
jgi:hypothetical protein